ncbi:hypothetical protein [Sandaracinus amylolyticus]|uniref:Lipoprotein n=1 Tax=Sandaracinus amylolyticus TaxID=927083 RepID=A0A0F6SFF7_9BACT|nr:hypothetical protein [Sandaracinus amylolyticus]AKF06864.1 hypothetical protein DB32_004013 [Sandaracinus amylolyticus]
MRTVLLRFALATLVLAGCGLTPPGEIVFIPLTDPLLAQQVVDVDATTGEVRSWASAPLDSEDDRWIPYPGRVRIQVDHDLGRAPNGVLVYLSFTEDGRTPALAAGDLARIEVSNEEHVVVWNDTNGNYFARVVVF